MKNFKLEDIDSPGFKVPAGYFESLEDRVMHRINSDSAIQLVPTPKKRTAEWIYAAAAILILVFVLPVMNLAQSGEAEFNVAAVEEYLQFHPSVSDDEVIELLTYSELSQLEIPLDIPVNELEAALPSGFELETLIN